MKEKRNKSVTLLELLIAIVLLSVLVLGLTSIDVFSRHHVISSDRRSKLQNELYLILEHMTKNVGLAIGNEALNGSGTVVNESINVGVMESSIIKVYIDASGDGIRQAPIVNPAAGDDHWIAYRYFDINSASGVRNRVQYCGRCSDGTCSSCMDAWSTLGTHVINFPLGALTENYVAIGTTVNPVVACWDPAGSCGSTDDPQINMLTRIKLPSIATN